MPKEPLEIFHRLSRAISRAANIEEIYQIILEEIATTLQVERASIMRLDPQSGRLKIVAARGIDPNIWRGVEMVVGEGVSGKVYSEGKPLLIKKLENNPRYQTHSFMVAPVTCFPMKVGTTPIGVINLTDKKTGETFTQSDLKLLTTLSDQVAAYMHLYDLAERLKTAEKAKLQLEVARDIQQKLLPQNPPKIPGAEMAGCLIPAERVGADYYDFFPNGKTIGVCIADVSGHSVGGALLASAFRSSLRAELQQKEEPSGIVRAVNKVLFNDLFQSEQFISFFYAQYQTRTKKLLYTNAGHNPPLLLRKGGKNPQWLFTQDSLLGIESDLVYHQKQLQCSAGDLLVLYTDGLTEAANKKKDRFGSQRLLDIATKNAKESASNILKNLIDSWRGFIDQQPAQDDVTVVVLKVS